MKKTITLFLLLLFFIGVRASDSDKDYVYASELKYDEEFELYYFDVILEGTNIYTGYGMDILLPKGLEVVVDDEGILVLMNNSMYPVKRGQYSHSVQPSFPYIDDHSYLRVGCMSSSNLDLNGTSGTLFSVYVTNNYEEGSWPLGSIKLEQVELNKVGEPYDAPTKSTNVILHSGETNLPLNISSSVHWGTCILPFSCALPSGVKAYTCNSKDEENLLLTEVPQLTAYTPYILYSEAGYSGNLIGEVETNQYPADGFVKSGYLSGAIVPQVVKDGYVLQNLPLKEGVKFYSCNGEDYNIPAGKCWVKIDGSSARERFGFAIDNSQTGINKVNVASDKVLYSISGVRMSDTTAPGFYIVNGRKVLKY